MKHDDETYSNIVYDGRKNVSIASLPNMADRTVVVGSFSKTHAMTRWRVGFAVGPPNVIEEMAKLQESVSTCMNVSAQQACLVVLNGPQNCVEEMVAGYKERKDLLLDELEEIPGTTYLVPEGSFYVFPNIKQLGISSKETAMMFLEKARVVAVRGIAFGESGEGYLKISFCGSKESIWKGLSRLHKMIC